MSVENNSNVWRERFTGEIAERLELLSHRLEKGQYLGVKKGKLCIRESKGFKNTFHEIFHRKHEEKKVKKLITATVQHITAYSNQKTSLQNDYRELFFVRLAKLSEKVFDRKAIDRSFQYMLREEINREEPRERQEVLQQKVERVKLAIDLGVELKPIEAGNSGSYFAVDYTGEKLGVFKPASEDSLGVSSPKLRARINRFFLTKIMKIDTAKPFWASEGHVAEAMTSKLAEHLGMTKVTPASKAMTLKSASFHSAKKAKEAQEEVGSFQEFIPGTTSLDKKFKLNSMGAFFGGLSLKLNVWRYKDKISQGINRTQFEQLAILDYLICNRDRHFENILMSEEDMHLIDNQLAWPKAHPEKSDALYRRNQYKWEVFPQANDKFDPGLKEQLDRLLTGPNLQRLLQELQAVKVEGHSNNAFDARSIDPVTNRITSQQEEFLKRVAVLRLAVGKKMTPKQLAQIRSQEEIDDFLQRLLPQGRSVHDFLGLPNP